MVFGSDDLLEPTYIQRAVEVFDKYPNVGLVFAPVRSIDSRDQEIGCEPIRKAELSSAGDEAVSALLTKGICTVTTIFRKDCYERLGGYDTAIRDGPDLELCARIAAHYDVYDLGQIGGAVRVHDAKTGHLSYLRLERLDSYINGQRKIWKHLSPAGLSGMGIADLETYIKADGARFACNGALTSLAFGRSDMSRYYLRRVIDLDPHWWRSARYWQAFGLQLFPPLGKRLTRSRMRID
jgi:hypothetical protein